MQGFAACSLAVGLLLGCAASPPPAPPAAPAPPVHRSGPPVYLVPVGDFPQESLDSLLVTLRGELDVEAVSAPPVELPAEAWNPEREQYAAQTLLRKVVGRLHAEGVEYEADVIAVTRAPLYIRGLDWRYAFAYRAAGRFGVVSTAHMDPRNFGEEASDEEVQARLRKMVIKSVAILRWSLPVNDDPESLLYGRVLSPEDLDRIDEATLQRDILLPVERCRSTGRCP